MNRILSLQTLPTQSAPEVNAADSTDSWCCCSSFSFFEECEGGYDIA